MVFRPLSCSSLTEDSLTGRHSAREGFEQGGLSPLIHLGGYTRGHSPCSYQRLSPANSSLLQKPKVNQFHNAQQILVPMERIERSTPPLPRECSTTELHRRVVHSHLRDSFRPARSRCAR